MATIPTFSTIKVPGYNGAQGFPKMIETEKAYGFINHDNAIVWLPKKALSLRARVCNELGIFLCFDLARWFKLAPEQKALLVA